MSTDNPKYFPPVAGGRLEEGTHMQFPWPIPAPHNMAFWDPRFFVVRIDPYLLYGHDRGYWVRAVVNSRDHGPTHGFALRAETQLISVPEHVRRCKTIVEAKKARRELQRFTPILDPTIRISDAWPPSEEEFEEWRTSQKLRHPLPGRIDGELWPDSRHQVFRGQQAQQVKKDSGDHLLVPHMGDLAITEAACWQWGWRLVQDQATPNDYLARLEQRQATEGLPWAIVTFESPLRLTGHVMESRTSRDDIAIRSSLPVPEGLPDQFLTLEIQSKDALERNRERSPLFEHLWRCYLEDADSHCMWLCLPLSNGNVFHSAKGLEEHVENDEGILHRIAIEHGTYIRRVYQGS